MMSLQTSLRPVRRRIKAQRAVTWLCYGMMVGAAFMLLIRSAAFFWPVQYAGEIGWGCLSTAALLGLLAGWLWPVSMRNAAKHADACGLMARVQTAWELQADHEHPMALLQREDAQKALGLLHVRDCIPLRPHRISMLVACVCVALSVGLGFVPNPQHDVLRAKAAFRQEMAKQADLLTTGSQNMEEKNAKSVQETRKILGDLARELRTATDSRQALTAMDTAERKLESLRQTSAESLRSLLASKGMSDLAEALEKQDDEALRSALEGKDNSELAQALSEAAEGAEDSAVADALQNASQAAAGGNLSQVQAALNAAMASTSASSAQGNALVQMARTAAARAGQSLGNAAQGSMPQGIASLGTQGANGAGTAGSGGSGQGAGSGAGQGSTNLDAGYQSSTSRQASQGSRAPKENLGTYEAIYDPTRLGGDGAVAQERGVMGQGETTEATLGAGLGSVSESVPYTQVAYEYQQAAVQAVQNADLPIYVQKWVENYFQSLLE